MKSSSHIMRRLGLTFFLIAIGVSSQVWTDCDYCENIHTTGMQLCNGTGSSTCGLYYTYAKTTCCSNQQNVNCADVVELGRSIAKYRFTTGTYCNGTYRCANRTSSPCSNDVAVATSSDCVKTGPEYTYSIDSYECE